LPQYLIFKIKVMKKVLLVLLFIPTLLIAQQREKYDTVNPIYEEVFPIENGRIVFSEVVPVDNVSKDELFVRANSWIARTFNSPKDVIQFNDKEAGKIICKTVTGATVGKGFNKVTIDPVYFILQIETREGRYRIVASDFIHEYRIKIGQITNEGENLLEEYYRLKEPTKKELENNFAIAEVISNRVLAIFESAKLAMAVQSNTDDDW